MCEREKRRLEKIYRRELNMKSKLLKKQLKEKLHHFVLVVLKSETINSGKRRIGHLIKYNKKIYCVIARDLSNGFKVSYFTPNEVESIEYWGGIRKDTAIFSRFLRRACQHIFDAYWWPADWYIDEKKIINIDMFEGITSSVER